MNSELYFPRLAHGNRTQPNVGKREEINGADASRIRWRRILNINITIEIKSLVSEAPKRFKLAMASRRAAFSGNTSWIATFFSWTFFAISYGWDVISGNRSNSAFFERVGHFQHRFQKEGALPTNHCWRQKTRVIAVLCGAIISAVHHLFLLQYTRRTDGQTDGWKELRQQYRALHYMQSHGKTHVGNGVGRLMVMGSKK